MADQKTIGVYNQKAREYADLTRSNVPDADLQAFIDLMPAGGRVLDLGCGPAFASAHMRAAGLIPDPIDASPEMVQTANELHDIGARQGTFDDITEQDRYAGVWANFSLLHANRDDLPRYLRALNHALTLHGTLHIGMKTGAGANRDSLDRFYTYVSIPELHGLLADAGLTVTYTGEGVDKALAGTLDPWVVCRAQKDHA